MLRSDLEGHVEVDNFHFDGVDIASTGLAAVVVAFLGQDTFAHHQVIWL